MFLSDQWAERHILDAQKKGEFENLVGAGSPLVLDDDSAIPKELRVAYRILKNAGYIPAELQDRKEALELQLLLRQITGDARRSALAEKRLQLLKLKMQQAGISTDFLDDATYRDKLQEQFNGESGV